MNNILDIARKLGSTIQESEEFKSYLEKEENFHNDHDAKNIQASIDEKNEKYKELIIEGHKEDVDSLAIEINSLNYKLMENNNYKEYKLAEYRVKKLIENINNILEYYTGISSKSGCGNCSGKCGK